MKGLLSAPDAWHVAILIPARNEEVLLPRCLTSVLQAARQLPADATVDIVVVADTCVDATARVATKLLGRRGTVVPTVAGNVGVARGLAARHALLRNSGSNARCWLANTDADCEVPETWLLQQLQFAQRGFAAVAGIVDVDCFAEHSPIVKSRFRLTYQLHDDGTHPHVHGANLGVRADAYLAAGGWGGLETAEDHDLWGRLKLSSAAACLSDSSLQVLTSGRRVGRAPLGFAGALAKHNLAAMEDTAA